MITLAFWRRTRFFGSFHSGRHSYSPKHSSKAKFHSKLQHRGQAWNSGSSKGTDVTRKCPTGFCHGSQGQEAAGSSSAARNKGGGRTMLPTKVCGNADGP